MGLSELAKGLAVAVNGAVVPKGRWTDTALEAGDSIEVIHAVQGG
ncbi:MAG: sulfur carrier protein ThiS [bacterium]